MKGVMTGVAGYALMKSLYTVVLAYLGWHAFIPGGIIENDILAKGPEGPAQKRGGILSYGPDHIPSHDDWPNVDTPELQYWPRRMNR